jgi:hypothetical protein
LAPEHSHIPLSRKTPFPGGGELPRAYYDAMDPFVVLAAAAQLNEGSFPPCWNVSPTSIVRTTWPGPLE